MKPELLTKSDKDTKTKAINISLMSIDLEFPMKILVCSIQEHIQESVFH